MQRVRRLLALALAVLFLLPVTAFGSSDQGQAHVPPLEGEPAVKHQFRAAWVASVTNIDWPSRTGLSAEQQQVELITILDQLKAMGMNAVVLQIRPTDDAFYRSNLNPWSKYLTGVPGQDPGYDPLAFAIEEAHQRNLEFHAWFNPYRVSMDTKRENLAEGSFAKAHPEYVVAYGGKLYYDPGIPEAEEHVRNSILEVVANYDIDAVHFDDYFYPYPSGTTDFPDQATFEQYGAGFANKADWRRQNINRFVESMGPAIKATKPHVQFGVSPFGIWRNKSASVPEGSETRGSESYVATSADTRLWVKEGWLDYIAPQIYWSIGFAVADYQKLATWWADVVQDTPTKLYIGHAAYKVNNNADPNWKVAGEITKQLDLNLTLPQVAGSIFFSYKDLRNNPLGVKDEVAAAYRYPALVPAMDWMDGAAPSAPTGLKARREARGVRLTWDDAGDGAAYYVIYRAPLLQEIDFNDARYIQATVRRSGDRPSFLDTSVTDQTVYRYWVTAVDRLHNEGPASKPETVLAKD